MRFIELVKRHPNRLGYGFLHYLFSLPGQSAIVNLFIDEINRLYGISNKEFGVLYSLASLLSAFTIPFFGKYIDRIKIRKVSVINAICFIFFILLMSYANHWVLLFIGLYGLRLTGLGMMSLIASTAIARFFNQDRGKALALSGLGLPVGEAVFPALVVLLISRFNMTIAWQVLGAGVLLIFIPLVLFLVKKHDVFQLPSKEEVHQTGIKSKTRKEVLGNWKFYLLLIHSVTPAMIMTGLFIHQNLLVKHQGWTLQWLATCFFAFGLVKIIVHFLAGSLIDKFSAKQLFPFTLIPIMLAMLLLLCSNHPMIAIGYLTLMGITASFNAVTGSALWVELFGAAHLGEIKSFISTFFVSATSVGAVIFGWFLNSAESMQLSFILLSVYVIGMSVVTKQMLAKHF